jgi:trigger factor
MSNVSIEKVSPVQAKLKIQVPATTVNERLNDYFTHLAKHAKIPGFRPGKVTPQVAKQHYGAESSKEISERIISEFAAKAITENKMTPVIAPMLVSTDVPTENKDFNFEIQVDLKPKMPKVKVKGLKVEKAATPEASDEDIQKELDAAREQDASFKDISEDREARQGDCVVINYSGSINMVPHPQMQSEGETVVIGGGKFLPDLEQGIIGLKKGENKNVDVKFPEEYHDKEVAGKIAEFKLTLQGIKEKVLPEIDDDFAKGMDESVSSLAELKAKMKKRIEDQREKDAEAELLQKVGDALVKKHPMKLSERHIEMVAHQLAERTLKMMQQMGMPKEAMETQIKEVIEKSKDKAARDIQLTYILEVVAEDQKIEVNDADVEKRFKDVSERSGLSIAEIKKYYSEKDEGHQVSRIESLKMDIRDQKSLDYALSQATIKVKG